VLKPQEKEPGESTNRERITSNLTRKFPATKGETASPREMEMSPIGVQKNVYVEKMKLRSVKRGREKLVARVLNELRTVKKKDMA